MADRSKEERIVAARMRLKERFEERMRESPGRADPRPGGSGPPNRHGMPKLPPGQYETTTWPVLDLGRQPQVPLDKWTLAVDGCCDNPYRLTWTDFQALEQVDDTSDFHCVTTWSKFDLRWRGVRVADLIARALPHDDAEHLLCHAYDGYTTNVALAQALEPDVLLVHSVDGKPLPREHGGPVRMITPQLYAWKGAKWISRLEILDEEKLGFWEERGYSSTAHPWRDDRYS